MKIKGPNKHPSCVVGAHLEPRAAKLLQDFQKKTGMSKSSIINLCVKMHLEREWGRV